MSNFNSDVMLNSTDQWVHIVSKGIRSFHKWPHQTKPKTSITTFLCCLYKNRHTVEAKTYCYGNKSKLVLPLQCVVMATVHITKCYHDNKPHLFNDSILQYLQDLLVILLVGKRDGCLASAQTQRPLRPSVHFWSTMILTQFTCSESQAR